MSWVVAAALVAVAGAASVVALSGLARWVRWVVAGGGVLGAVGLAATAAATVNLAVPRTCAPGDVAPERDRPVVSLVVGGRECREEAVGAAQLPVLAGLSTSLAVARRTGVRR